MAHKLTTCTFCGVGCGLYLETDGKNIFGAYPSMSHPTNRGRICIRGWHVHEVASAPDRLKKPLIKKNGTFVETTWDEAVNTVVQRLREIKEKYGSDSLAFLCSPRCSNEESYLLQKFARAVIGTNNVDHGTGVYGHNSINVLLEMIGVPASTNSIEELDKSEVIIVDGVDLGKQLPTIGGRVIRAHLNGAKVIVIDSRRHRVAENADIFLQIRPGTEYILYGAMCKIIYDKGLCNRSFIKGHCQDFDKFLESIRGYDLIGASDECGVAPDLIEKAATWYATAKNAAILYSTGIESRRVESIIGSVNLCLIAGQIGKEGAGIYPLTEHNNLQGVCDMGMIPSRFAGYYSVEDFAGRARLEKIWGKRLPTSPGLNARETLTHCGDGKIKAIWLCRYDPVSTAFFADAVSSLERAEFVVVQHLFKTATGDYADVILPCTAYGEEQVTFTNTERRIQLTAKAIEPLGEAIPAWKQICMIANAFGENWDYNTAADVMAEIGRVVPFYERASYDNLSADYGRQWPCTLEKPHGTKTLFADGDIPYKFKFLPLPGFTEQRMEEKDYPLQLIFGHSLYYWHRNVLIQHSEILKREYRILLLDYPEGFVEVNTSDAEKLKVRDGEKVQIVARTGSAVAAVRLTNEIRQGTVFVPYFLREVGEKILGRAINGQDYVPVRIQKLTT
jgi:formate dehydrogenase major subunit